MENSLPRANIKICFLILQFVLFVAIAVVAPLTKQQFITGSIVNASLFISTATLGVPAAIMVGMLPSVTALTVGLLPTVLAPMVPFIIAGNALLVIIFSALYRKNSFLAVFIASVTKFVFLYATSSIVNNLLLKKTLARQIALMMSWPQLFTALVGGLVAIVFLLLLKKDWLK